MTNICDKPAGFYGLIAPPVPNAPSSRICGQNPQNDADATFLDPHISVVDCHCTPPRCQYCRCMLRLAGGCRNGKLQNVSPPSVLFESSWIFFTIHRRHRRKNDGPEFWNSNSVIFENFLKFSNRRRAVPLRPIWTVMVAAKLDQSRVLVTTFHQNRLTLKGRSACQSHTDRQTDVQTDRQARLKIMALQVCNRAKKGEKPHE